MHRGAEVFVKAILILGGGNASITSREGSYENFFAFPPGRASCHNSSSNRLTSGDSAFDGPVYCETISLPLGL